MTLTVSDTKVHAKIRHLDGLLSETVVFVVQWSMSILALFLKTDSRGIEKEESI
jgi:hypothetical protein